MLFNSYDFLFFFLPVCLTGYFAAQFFGRRVGAAWLTISSFVFYGWWAPVFLPVLICSVLFNYTASVAISRLADYPLRQKCALAISIGVNLCALGYFKYLSAVLGFASENLGLGFPVPTIVLPLGISFFTFTQIGFLVDVQQGTARERGFIDFVLFVTFFPHLIAGPILHNREIMPQFADPANYRVSTTNLGAGMMIFVIGLLKKTILADPMSSIVAAGFGHPANLGFFAAWNAVLSYSLQLYFDFSGYSDMAIGLARMFNIRFPANFDSPYKAASVIDYWQRWHMTLTRYITLYIYNPLALWVSRRHAKEMLIPGRSPYTTARGFAELIAFPTFVTITLAGVWHGAGLTFVVFGVLHGFYLIVNHGWRIFGPKRKKGRTPVFGAHVVSVLGTYLCVLVAMIFFRAPSCSAAMSVLAGMTGFHGLRIPPGVIADTRANGMGGIVKEISWLTCLYGIVWLMPNTQQIMRASNPVLGKVRPFPARALEWMTSPVWAVACGFGAALSLMAIGGTTEFIYFRF